ncbi:class I SAM-dependent methyltransferase [Lewinella sp. IMCC34183]|uniref:class I SAM-dependent methyltransferase n=1 Tax=Lewinella sp. IMCC34183 TaxID=2248762 RepID=UPI000E21F7DC|nr:methyltransferase domain-containing protein [Lewinella sp. IMCC34183]
MSAPSSPRWRLAQFLELRWWRRYLRRRPPGEYLRDKRAYWQRVLDQLEWEVQPGVRTLDAGCGPAGIFILLHDRQRITALDPLLVQYEELPVFDRAHYPAVRFLPLPLEAAGRLDPYDCIYCFNAINHVADWEQCLDRLTQLARPGTRMILSSDVHRFGALYHLFRAVPGDALHPQQHRPAAYREALRRRGWRIERETLLRTTPIFDYRAWVCQWEGSSSGSV